MSLLSKGHPFPKRLQGGAMLVFFSVNGAVLAPSFFFLSAFPVAILRVQVGGPGDFLNLIFLYSC